MDRHSQRLDTSLKLQQRLTPLQVQYVRMLEMTAPEMEDEVARALSEMPALEADDHQERDLRTALPTEDGDASRSRPPTFSGPTSPIPTTCPTISNRTRSAMRLRRLPLP